jgi:hypothetical protein
MGDITRDVLSYNQLLEKARALLDSSETMESNTNAEENQTNIVDIEPTAFLVGISLNVMNFQTTFIQITLILLPIPPLLPLEPKGEKRKG